MRERLVLVLVAALSAASGAGAAGIGVAPFEAVVPAGQRAPDVAAHVAQRLATRGVGPVVGPHALGAPATFEPRPAEAQGWAERAGVDAVVVGRTTKLGSRLSLHARLLDGASGKPVGVPVVEEVARPEELGRSIDRLTGALLDRIAQQGARRPPETPEPRPAPRAEGERRTGGGPRVASGPPAATEPEAKPRSEPEAKRRATASFDRDKPLSIQSDELEAAPDADGRRHLLFAGHVRAVQGELSLRADRLEAFYPAGASEPERLQARGHVTVEQGDRVARCAEATFFRSEERVVCTGQLAELEQACDRVRGPRITFHLGSERLEVEGGADVSLRPDGPGCGETAVSGGSGR